MIVGWSSGLARPDTLKRAHYEEVLVHMARHERAHDPVRVGWLRSEPHREARHQARAWLFHSGAIVSACGGPIADAFHLPRRSYTQAGTRHLEHPNGLARDRDFEIRQSGWCDPH